MSFGPEHQCRENKALFSFVFYLPKMVNTVKPTVYFGLAIHKTEEKESASCGKPWQAVASEMNGLNG
eukprot:s1959_g13.t1